MSRFASSWLALREPADHAARSATLARRFAAAQGPAPHVVDLGAGSGSNCRFLAPLLPTTQRWLLLDNDAALLELARGSSVTCRVVDLASALPPVADMTGVTAAALLDLVTARWLEDLVRWATPCPLLMALSVDGQLLWQPEDAEDESVRQSFFAHQRGDKGFGPALGPEAVPCLAGLLEERGYRVLLERSDWQLAAGELLGATLEGIVAIAGASERWAGLRRCQLASDELRLTVGHLDLLALPSGTEPWPT